MAQDTIYICEKRPAAQELAKVLSGGRPVSDRGGFLDTGAGRVHYLRGHALRALEPGEMNPEWKHFGNYGSLPMLPRELKFVPVDRELSMYLAKLKSSLSGARRVVVATDTGREGDLIGHLALKHCGFTGKAERLPLTALDSTSIREQLSALRENSAELQHYYNVGALEGLTRAYCDYIFGMNASRAASLRLKAPGDGMEPFAGGGVKYPMVKMIVDRQRSIDNFKPQTYWTAEVELDVLGRNMVLPAVDAKTGEVIRFKSREEAVAATGKPQAQVSAIIEKATDSVLPPRFLNTDGLLAAGGALGWSPSKTMKVANRLYSKGLISYPRVEGDKLPYSHMSRVDPIMSNLMKLPGFEADIRAAKNGEWTVRRGLRYVTLEKAGSHQAIVPTLKASWDLEGDERQLYRMIAMNYARNHLPDGIDHKVKVNARIGDVDFSKTEVYLAKPGWRTTDPKSLPSALPAEFQAKDGKGLQPGTTTISAKVLGSEQRDHQTKPPEPFKRSKLAGHMARLIDHVPASLRPALVNHADPDKPKGLGTPATRHVHIDEAIEQNRYIKTGPGTDPSLSPTSRGFGVVEGFEKNFMPAVDPVSRAVLEEKLTGIGQASSWAEAEAKSREAVRAMQSLVTDLVDKLRHAKPAQRHNVVGDSLPPTQKQLELVKKLAKEKRVKVPDGARTDRIEASRFIDQLIGGKPQGEMPPAAGNAQGVKPSSSETASDKQPQRKAAPKRNRGMER